MSRIRVRHFGPIRGGCLEDDGWIDIRKATVFIGNQGSGKSTVAKLISTFFWMEKALVRGDYSEKWFERKNKLKNQLLHFHRLENYFKTGVDHTTEIDFQGEAFRFEFRKGALTIEELSERAYSLPQIMYVPAERNFITYVRTPKELKLSSDSLKEFLTEFENAKAELREPLELPVNDTALEYDRLNDTLNLKGEGYKVRLTEASSGFQSLVPLYLVSHHLAHQVKRQSGLNLEPMSGDEIRRFRRGVEDIWGNGSLTDEQKRIALSVLSAQFNKTAFLNIVEEPEQNLFPSSQQKMLYSLLGFNNMNRGNKLVITTHSPYMLNYLTLCVKAHALRETLTDASACGRIDAVVPSGSTIAADDLSMYEFDHVDGSVRRLEKHHGLPSDSHGLNEGLDESNESFARLLDIQQGA